MVIIIIVTIYLSTCYAPGTVLSILRIISFNPHNNPGKYYYSSHFKGEKIEAERS